MTFKPRAKRELRLEMLEGRELLSTMSVATEGARHIAPSMAVSAEVARSRGFNFLTSGTLNQMFSNPDTGKHYQISTSGRVAGLGAVKVTGELNTPGFIMSSTVTGNLTIHSRRGTLQASLSSAPVPGFSSIPNTLTFTITGGTGAFVRYHTGHGTIQVTLLPGGTQNEVTSVLPVKLAFSGRIG